MKRFALLTAVLASLGFGSFALADAHSSSTAPITRTCEAPCVVTLPDTVQEDDISINYESPEHTVVVAIDRSH